MSLLIGNSRRRKLFLATIAIAAGGYVSYRLYNSSAFARRRRRLLQILSTMSFCFGAVSDSSESLSILARDLKSFLLSDDDSVPQSLRQAFKIGQCPEFQESVTVVSAALTRGLLGATAMKGRKQVQGYVRGQGIKSGCQSLQVKDNHVASGEDTTCREIREVCFTTKKQERSKSFTSSDSIPFAIMEKGRCEEREMKSSSSGADVFPKSPCKVGAVPERSIRGQKESIFTEDLPDRLLSKMFSEPGVGFASAVAGTLARNVVLAFFDGVRLPNEDPGSSSQSSACNDMSGVDDKTSRILDVLCTDPCRMLIADCMQTFISTAVTVYVDKTKDVNVYDDMIAGITNPSHKGPMKEVMTSVCNGAIETFVKTSYNVMFAKQIGQNKSLEIQEYTPVLPSPSEGDVNIAEGSNLAAQAHEQTNTGRSQSLIDGVSKTLAIPSNRKLVVDVAGTMTSEAVKSFVDVVMSTISISFQQSWEKLKSSISASNQGLHLQERSNMAVKAVLLASVCLAVWLHILMGVRLLERSQTSILFGR